MIASVHPLRSSRPRHSHKTNGWASVHASYASTLYICEATACRQSSRIGFPGNYGTYNLCQPATHRASSRLFALPLRVWPRFLAADTYAGRPNAYNTTGGTCRTAASRESFAVTEGASERADAKCGPEFHSPPLSFSRDCCGSQHHQPHQR